MEVKMSNLLDLELREAIEEINEIDYEDNGFPVVQRAGALAVSDLIEEFTRTGTCKDKKLLALVLVRLRDLQVRDFAMGITNDENIQTLCAMWSWLMHVTPAGYLAPVTALYSAISYEQGDASIAIKAIEQALQDDPKYPLALLLRRVYAAGWPPSSFANMRRELHPKVCAALFSE